MGRVEKQILCAGVAQMFCRRSLQENLDQVLKMIGDVRDRGCDVAVFPESILCDFDGEASVSDFERAVERVKSRARACGIHTVVGVSAEVISKHHNRALVMDRKGEEVMNYQKNTEVPQRIWIDGIPCSVAICSDRWYIEHAELACLTQGSRVMIDISGGHGGDDGRPDLQWVRYRCWAVRNSVFVVVCNQPHDDEPDYRGNAIWGGHSAVLDPEGRFLVCAKYENDVIVTADLDVELAGRENAERRRNHPAFKFWWDMGKVVLEGDDVDAPPFVRLESPEAEIQIAAAQIACSGDVDDNVAQMVQALETASSEGADVVVFPERAVTGSGKSDADRLAQGLATIQEQVRNNGVYAVFGMPFVEDGHRYNSGVAMDREGQVLTRYDQISAHPDGPFTPGENTRAMWFEIDGVQATLTVGDDVYWPELTELAAYRGMQLHFHLDFWQGDSEDANLLRKHSAINHVMPGVCGVSVNAAGPEASGGSLLLRRVGGHGQPNPGGVETYLPYHISVVKTGGKDAEILYFTAKTGSVNEWQASKNRTRRNGRGHDNWWHWLGQGVRAIYAGKKQSAVRNHEFTNVESHREKPEKLTAES